jgi:hypothetical protein
MLVRMEASPLPVKCCKPIPNATALEQGRIFIMTTTAVTQPPLCVCCFFSSPELKAQVSFSDRLLAVVCPSVCLLEFYIFDFFTRTAGPILTKVGINHPKAKGIQNCTNE